MQYTVGLQGRLLLKLVIGMVVSHCMISLVIGITWCLHALGCTGNGSWFVVAGEKQVQVGCFCREKRVDCFLSCDKVAAARQLVGFNSLSQV